MNPRTWLYRCGTTLLLSLAGLLPLRADVDCFVFPSRAPAAQGEAGKVSGPTANLNSKILPLLTQVAQKHKIHIRINSGYRSPEEQAQAMYDNWEKLERGKVYKASTLPATSRTQLDEFQKQGKKAEFIAVAKDTVGAKSAHSQKIAVDITALDSKEALADLLKDFKEVKEGDRTDIHHLELKAR